MSVSPTRGMKGVTALLFLFLLFGLQAPDTLAQQADSSLVARFQLAESFLRAGRFQQAISLLEDLNERSPETNVFYERLRTAYENVKRFDDAIVLVERKIEIEPKPSLYIAEKARLQYLAGRDTLALETWHRAIEINPKSPGVYLLVYRSLMQVRLFDHAISFLEMGRRALDNNLLFQTDLAYLYGLNSEHEKAINEYISLLSQNENQLNFVRSRLNQFIANDGALRQSIAAVEAAVASTPLNRSFRELLAWLYIEDGRFSDAFTINRAIDRLESEDGRVLFGFAQLAAEAGAYEVAAQAYGEILERYPLAVSSPEALRGLAMMTEQWAEVDAARIGGRVEIDAPGAKYRDALDTYRLFLDQYPRHRLYADVLRRIGHLQQNIFFDLESAEKTLIEVIAKYSHTVAADEAALGLGKLYLMKNDFVQSEIQYSRLIARLRTGDLADEGRFELALLYFYRGQFESALTLTTALQENTSADVANDAIELKLSLIENKGPDSLDTPLTMYSRALLLRRQRKQESALAVLEKLIEETGEHALMDDAMFQRAELLEMIGRTEDSYQAFAEIPLVYPGSLLSDRSLMSAARLQSDKLDDPAGAIQTLSTLLTDYPGSLLVSEARARIRNLRGDGA